MAAYRLYSVRTGAHFGSVQALDCANDRAAIDTSRQYVCARAMEPWQCDRMVRTLPAEPPEGPLSRHFP